MTTYEEWQQDEVYNYLHRIKSYYARDARRRIGAGRGQTVMHLDGNPYNNDPANLRIVDKGENYGRK